MGRKASDFYSHAPERITRALATYDFMGDNTALELALRELLRVRSAQINNCVY